MSASGSEPKLLIPQLKPFYDFVEPLSWLLIRLTVGLMILPHGWPKLMAGIEGTAATSFLRRGLWVGIAEPMAVFLILLETAGGSAWRSASSRDSLPPPSRSKWPRS